MAESEVLARIIEAKRSELAERRAAWPLEELRCELRPSERSLEAALRAPRTGYILECKRASPSRGVLREDFDPAALARDYASAADAISVITDGPFFQGELASLQLVRDAVRLPVLCKDFVIDPYQVVEARAHGADAILLMLSVLDDEGYRACARVAEELQLDVLTEVHDEDELTRAEALGARIIGINNRNLRDLSVDLSVTERLAPKVGSDAAVVCESGIADHAQVRRLRGLVDGFLVGTSLVTAADPARATRELVYGRVKVCGLTRPEDALAAWEAGATWGGLIFAEDSPRCVGPQQAAELRAAAPLLWAGVFVNETPERVATRVRELELDAVQLHGDEDRAQVRLVRALMPEHVEVWKAVRVQGRVPLRGETGAQRLLVDAFHAGLWGGTGQVFDWSLLDDHPEREELLVAGGLTPARAADADRLGAWALDVNSGVESAPGEKSATRLRAFFAALRGETERR